MGSAVDVVTRLTERGTALATLDALNIFLQARPSQTIQFNKNKRRIRFSISKEGGMRIWSDYWRS